MATKSTKKSTKKTASKTPATSARKMTARECIAAHEVLRFHVKIITVLSIAVCVLVAALLFTVARG